MGDDQNQVVAALVFRIVFIQAYYILVGEREQDAVMCIGAIGSLRGRKGIVALIVVDIRAVSPCTLADGGSDGDQHFLPVSAIEAQTEVIGGIAGDFNRNKKIARFGEPFAFGFTFPTGQSQGRSRFF